MVIEYKIKKNSIKIYSANKVLSSKFKQWLLLNLIESFALFEISNEQVKKIDILAISQSAKLTDSYISALRTCYETEIGDDYLSWEEFLETERVNFADIYIFRKDMSYDQINFKNAIACIDLVSDGSLKSIYITVKSDGQNIIEYFLKIISEYNEFNKTSGLM